MRSVPIPNVLFHRPQNLRKLSGKDRMQAKERTSATVSNQIAPTSRSTDTPLRASQLREWQRVVCLLSHDVVVRGALSKPEDAVTDWPNRNPHRRQMAAPKAPAIELCCVTNSVEARKSQTRRPSNRTVKTVHLCYAWSDQFIYLVKCSPFVILLCSLSHCLKILYDF